MWLAFDRRLRLAAALALGAALWPAGSEAAAADRIRLRSLDVIRDRVVVDFDVDGVRLDDQRLLGWDEIERASLGLERQAAFDRMLKELGEPLYRIRQRLKVGDYAGLRRHAEQLHEKYVSRPSEAGFMVSQALMWARLAAGERERALAPCLECCAKLQVRPELARSLPGTRNSQIDLGTGFTPELPPLWFDSNAARQSLAEATRRAAEVRQPRPPGVYVYCATLALAAGDQALASRMLDALPPEEPWPQWRGLVEAQAEVVGQAPGAAVAQLHSRLGRLPANARPLGLYWLGRAHLQSGRTADGMLMLLRLPASYGGRQPELAGAALHACMRALEDSRQDVEAVAVRRELLEQYPATHFARRLQAAAQPVPDAADQ